jgi:predicted Zn-dependent protease
MFSQAQQKIKAQMYDPLCAHLRANLPLRAIDPFGKVSCSDFLKKALPYGRSLGRSWGLWGALLCLALTAALSTSCGPRSVGYQPTPPSASYAWYARSLLLESQGDIDGAIDAMHRALVADQGAPILMASTARLLCTHHRTPDNATALLRLAGESLQPQDPGWLTFTSAEVACALSTGDVTAAAAASQRALSHYPQDPDALTLDADVALRQGDTARAHARLTTLAAQHPTHLLYAQKLAALDLTLGDPDLALARLLPMLSEAAPEPFFMTIADAYAAIQDLHAAHDVLRACLDAHFRSVPCQQRLSALLTHLPPEPAL